VSSRDATFTFSSPDAGAGATFMCAIDAATSFACTSPHVLHDLSEETHTFSVRVRDAAGNFDPTPALRTWRVDLTAPFVLISHVASPTNDATPAFTFALIDAPSTVECRFDGDPFVPCTSPYEAAAPLADGSHAFEVRVGDDAGNTRSSVHFVTIDTVAPEVAIAPVASPTNDTTPTFTFTATGGAIALACRFEVAPFAACTSPYTRGDALLDGDRTFEVRATDAAGNVGTATRSVTIDTEAPHVVITDFPSATVVGDVAHFAWEAPGATETECSIHVAGESATAWFACMSPHDQAVPSFSGTSETFLFHVRARDAAGNTQERMQDFFAAHP
jgi:hypothetical protein